MGDAADDLIEMQERYRDERAAEIGNALAIEWRVISICPPWSSWIRDRLKTLETRTWATKYRGPILIHASKRVDEVALLQNRRRFEPYQADPAKFFRGHIVAIAELVDCRMMQKADEKNACMEWEPGRYVFALDNIRPVVPVPLKGALGIFKIKGLQITEERP